MNTLNPTCKFVGILLPTVLLLFFYSPVINLFVFLFSLSVTAWCTRSRKTLCIAMVPILLSALALFFTGMRFPSNSHLALNYKLFSNSAVWNGLQLSSRVLAFAGLGVLFSLTTDRVELIRSVHQQWKLPAKFAYGMLAALGIMPNILKEYRKARLAFRARGLSPAPWSAALLKPVLVKTVRWSEALAAAMESKGFGSENRTEYYIIPVTGKDRIFPVLTAACFLFAVFLEKAVSAFL